MPLTATGLSVSCESATVCTSINSACRRANAARCAGFPWQRRCPIANRWLRQCRRCSSKSTPNLPENNEETVQLVFQRPCGHHDRLYQAVSVDVVAAHWARLPLHAHVFQLRSGGHTQVRAVQGRLADVETRAFLQSMGWERLRSSTVKNFFSFS